MMNETMEQIARLMALAARTAPKAHGRDYLEIRVLAGDAVGKLGDDMIEYGAQSGRKNFDRDGENVKKSSAVLLLALKGARTVGLDCGACGFPKCSMLPQTSPQGEFEGPICAWRLIDLGVALGSAAKVASMLNADNRIMYRIGVSARRLGLVEGEIAVGIPLSATGKNIFFDRT